MRRISLSGSCRSVCPRSSYARDAAAGPSTLWHNNNTVKSATSWLRFPSGTPGSCAQPRGGALVGGGTKRGASTSSSQPGGLKKEGVENQQQQQQQQQPKSGLLSGDANAAAALQPEPVEWVDEDETLSLDPKDYEFDQDDEEDTWERVAGLTDKLPYRGGGLRARGYGKAKERLAKKFSIEGLDEDEEDEEADDDLPGVARARSMAEDPEAEEEEEEEEREILTPRERQRRTKEEEKDKKWMQIFNSLKDDIETQITSGTPVPLWYPHVDEYEGDGYDDYSRTLQDTWEDGSPYHRDYEYDEKEFKEHFAFAVPGYQHILNVGRHTKTTKGGRVFSFSATVIDGNGNGRAGWGYGKGPTLSDAVLAAQKDCERNSFYIDRYKGECITESIRFSYKKCSVELFALPEGRLHPKSSQVMQLVFNAFGLKYIAGKWMGSTNKTKRIKTLFMALQQIEHPEYLSEKLGMKLFKPRKVPRKHGRVWSYD